MTDVWDRTSIVVAFLILFPLSRPTLIPVPFLRLFLAISYSTCLFFCTSFSCFWYLPLLMACLWHYASFMAVWAVCMFISAYLQRYFWLAAWSHGQFWNVAFVPLLVLNSFVDVSCAGADNDNFYKMTNKLHQLERLCHRAMDIAFDIEILPSMMRAVRSELITHTWVCVGLCKVFNANCCSWCH